MIVDAPMIEIKTEHNKIMDTSKWVFKPQDAITHRHIFAPHISGDLYKIHVDHLNKGEMYTAPFYFVIDAYATDHVTKTQSSTKPLYGYYKATLHLRLNKESTV